MVFLPVLNPHISLNIIIYFLGLCLGNMPTIHKTITRFKNSDDYDIFQASISRSRVSKHARDWCYLILCSYSIFSITNAYYIYHSIFITLCMIDKSWASTMHSCRSVIVSTV